MNKTNLLVFIAYLFSFSSYGQYDITHYTVEDGLMSNKGRGIFQDSKGIMWLIDEYGFNRFNGRDIESIVGDEKLFEVIGPRTFREEGDTLFYTNNEYLKGHEYHELIKDYYSKQKDVLHFYKDGELVDSLSPTISYGLLSEGPSTFYFDPINSCFYLKVNSNEKKILDLTDFGDWIPGDIEYSNFTTKKVSGNNSRNYRPWFLDNLGRFYLKIKKNRLLRYNLDFSTDTLRSLPKGISNAFISTKGREYFFSNYEGFSCYERKNNRFEEVDRIEESSRYHLKIKGEGELIYCLVDRTLFKLSNNKFTLFKEDVIDFEITQGGSVVAVIKQQSDLRFDLIDLSSSEVLKENLQESGLWGNPFLYKDREGNIWVVSESGFYKLSKSRMTKKTIDVSQTFIPYAFDDDRFIFMQFGVDENGKNTQLKAPNIGKTSMPYRLRDIYHNDKYLWMTTSRSQANDTRIIRLNKTDLSHETTIIDHPETVNRISLGSFNDILFLKDEIYSIHNDTLKFRYSDPCDNCYLRPFSYQYEGTSFEEFSAKMTSQVLPDKLLCSRRYWSKSPAGETIKKRERELFLLDTKQWTTSPFKFDERNNKLLMGIVVREGRQLFIVQNKEIDNKQNDGLKLFELDGEELKLVKRIDHPLLNNAKYLLPMFETDDLVFFQYKQNKVFYFDLNSLEVSEFKSEKINAGLMHNIVGGADPNVFYVNDLGKSYLVDFSNYIENKEVEIIEKFDFNATGFYENDRYYYFGKTSELLSYEKTFTTPIDSIPLYLNDIGVYNAEFKRLSEDQIVDRVFTSDQNNFVFELETASFYQPESIYYQYRVKGLNNEIWRSTKSDSISIDNLSPGHYTLEVKALNIDDVTSNVITYQFTITPPFWRTWWFRVAVFILFFIGIYIFYKLRVRKLKQREVYLEHKVDERTAEVVKQKERAEEQQKLVEEKNAEILDSINYAKRLQDAILPSEKIVSSYLVDSFIFYRPKDIVAGDFYFMDIVEENGKKLIYYAAADCTGHGVPGAMVSIVGANGLKRCIQEFGLRDPGKILDQLSKLVADNFAQSEERIRDGMDIALCCLELEGESIVEVNYAGANNPLWVINPTRTSIPEVGEPFKNGGGFEIKADKHAIGYSEAETKFTTQSFKVVSGDMLYTFSDGFADQFGGERGKKYKSANFKKFLVNLYTLPVESQKKQVVDEFDRWKGTQEQIDDVCVIGVKV